MNNLHDMISAHPKSALSGNGDLHNALETIASCAQVCTSCADACLAEPMVADLVRCIRLNLDCADVCHATGQVLTRQTTTEAALWRDLVNACRTACIICAEECDRHADMHEHCRICADHCRECARACDSLLQTVAA